MRVCGVYSSNSVKTALQLIGCLLLLACSALGQASAPDPIELHHALRDDGLDRTRVFRVRDAEFGVEDIHITLNEGVIALMEPVAGHTTGAFFYGDGEVLVVPPTQLERESLALHTGAAVLEERFSTAFFRFTEDFSGQWMSATRGPAEDAQAFTEKWGPAVRSLSQADALQLLSVLTWSPTPEAPGRRFFHARLAGTRLGTFDLYLDTAYEEQIFLGQANFAEGAQYYDIWAAFPMRSARNARSASATSEQPATELGRRDVVVRRYTIDSRVEPPHQLDCDTQLDVEVVEGGDRTVLFQLSRNLHVNSVEADGTPIRFIQNEALQGGELARRGNDLIAVVFPQPLRAGQKMRLRFRYAGPVMSEAGGGLMYVGARGVWYPNQGLAMADFDLRFSYPQAWTLVATGKKVSEDVANGRRRTRFVSERPIPLASFNLGEYVESSAKSGAAVVESFAASAMEYKVPLRTRTVEAGPPVFPGDSPPTKEVVEPRPRPAGHAPLVAQDAAHALDFLSQKLGPFPYSTLALTQMPGRDSLGWPGLIFLSSYAYLSPEERRGLAIGPLEEILYSRLVVAHEAAHQWWGDTVLRKGYRDEWLMEALANHYALLMVESERPQEFRLLMDNFRDHLLAKSSTGRPVKDAGPVTLGSRLYSSRVPAAYDAVVYGRGAWLIRMLGELLRENPLTGPGAATAPEELLLRTLRKLYEEHRGGELSTEDLRSAIEAVLPRSSWFEGRRSLGWFFDGWVNGTAIPKLALQSVRINSSGGKTYASGKLLQGDAPDRLVTAVPVYAQFGRRTRARREPVQTEDQSLTYIGRVFADGPETTFRLAVPAGARQLVLDPYETVLRQR